jgi:hypothetical protein
VEKPTNLDSLSESSAVDNSDWGQRVDNPNWDKPAKLTIEKIDAGADWAAAEKHAAELSKAEAESVTAKPQFIGIKAFYLREGDNPGPEKTIKFKTRIQSTNEYKTTMHWPGVIVRAMSPQGSQYSKRKDDSSFKVSTGNVLEILRVHQGDEYHVFSFAQRKRGIVKISLVEMMEEPQAVLADGMPRPSNPAAATV